MHPADGGMSVAEISAKMNDAFGAQLLRWQVCAFDTMSALLTLFTSNTPSIADVDCTKAAI